MSDFESFGWILYYHYIFKRKLDRLVSEVEKLKAKLPFEEYRKHPEVKKLKKLYNTIINTVPRNPEHPDFIASKIFGRHKHWRRVKNSPAPRYRLFFKFFKDQSEIIYAWFNDEHSLRKNGDKNDVYKIFIAMLERGDIPSSYNELKRESQISKT